MPKVNQVHVDAALSNVSLGYHPSGMIAEQVFPIVTVKKESDIYYKWNKDTAFRIPDSTKRADGTRSKTISFTVSTSSYQAEEYALNAEVTDRQKANADSVLRLRSAKIRRVKDLLMLDYEKRVADLLTTQGNWDSNNRTQLSGTQQWNNANFDTDNVTYSIEAQIDTGKEAVRTGTGGKEPNVIIIPAAVAKVVKKDPTIRELIKYTQNNLLVNGDLPPTMFNLKVMIPGAVNNTSVEGNSTQSYADIWGKHVVMLHVPQTAQIDEVSAGYTFRVKNAAHRPWQVKAWREEAEGKEVLETSVTQDEILTSNIAGYLIEDAIA